MAYPLDPAAQNNVLDAILGKQDTMPDAFEVALFNAHPSLGGTEVTGASLARAVIDNDTSTWPGASGGQSVSIDVDFGDQSDELPDTATHYLLIDAADSTTRYFPGRLLEEVDVGSAGVPVIARLAGFFNTSSL